LKKYSVSFTKVKSSQIYFLLIYAKSEKEDVSKEDILKALRELERYRS
jgi:hypothetical protein